MATDPAVSRRKFEREVGYFRAREEQYQRQGIWLLKAEFPEIFVVFGAPHAQPAAVVPFGTCIDFTDYDARPPSVCLVNAFTRAPLKIQEILPHYIQGNVCRFPRARPQTDPTRGEVSVVIDDLLQAFEDNVPFLCLAGIREYHESPAHSGDSWWLHRGTGEGTLHFLLNTIWNHGVRHIASIQFQIQARVVGLSMREDILQVPQAPAP